MTNKRYFLREPFTTSDTKENWLSYTPTIQKKHPNTVQISDNYQRKYRQGIGGFDRDFMVKVSKRNR